MITNRKLDWKQQEKAKGGRPPKEQKHQFVWLVLGIADSPNRLVVSDGGGGDDNDDDDDDNQLPFTPKKIFPSKISD